MDKARTGEAPAKQKRGSVLTTGALGTRYVFAALATVPAGAEAYESAGFSVFAFTDRSETLLPEIGLSVGNEWELKYEANTAYGFWLRRRADGTHADFRDGLRDLLSALDAEWLAAHDG